MSERKIKERGLGRRRIYGVREKSELAKFSGIRRMNPKAMIPSNSG